MATMFWLQCLRAAHNSCHFVRAFLGVTFFTDSVGGGFATPQFIGRLVSLIHRYQAQSFAFLQAIMAGWKSGHSHIWNSPLPC